MITIISAQDWEYIGGRNPTRKWARVFCRYILVEKGGRLLRKAEIRLVPYLILFLPVCVVTFLSCAWDGGLKDFSLPSRRIRVDHLEVNTKAWEHAKEVWERVTGR